MIRIPDEIAWVRALRPVATPRMERVASFSGLEAWHVDLALQPIVIEEGRPPLSGSETWNGKPLVVISRKDKPEGVAEVEIAQRLRNAHWDAYWSKGQGRWMDWLLRNAPPSRQSEFANVERSVRLDYALISRRNAGTPDVVGWDPECSLLHCIEYKGPQPSNPQRLDTIKAEQMAWLLAAIEQRLLSIDRYVVARWTPSPEAADLLRRQVSARAPSRRRGTVDRHRGRRRAGPVVATDAQSEVPPVVMESPLLISATWFGSEDPESGARFRAWREDHPLGFVINLRRPRSATFHLASCRALKEAYPRGIPMENSKAVSLSRHMLEAHASAAGWHVKDCGTCGGRLAP